MKNKLAGWLRFAPGVLLIAGFLTLTSAPLLANDEVSLHLLGVAQDAGYPQAQCYRPHCMAGWQDSEKQRLATSLAVIDHQSRQSFLFEATPDIKHQLYRLHTIASFERYSLSGIFLTHGHMGHYAGLMHLGREAWSADAIPVYAMPRMQTFLKNNGPWSQLVTLNNISLKSIHHQKPVKLTPRVTVTPILVPHRDEFTETVGYRIDGPNKSVLFIPDIDKWRKWSTDINGLVKSVDLALLDATFFDADELQGRDISQIPHPFVSESLARFAGLPAVERAKVMFIHFNHSNPLLHESPEGEKARALVVSKGMKVAREGWTYNL